MKFDWLFNAPVAHRGLHDDKFPENSIPAFEKAIENGFNIEIDVHLSRDGVLVVFHDDNLKRVCGVDKAVKDCTVKELKEMRLCGTEYTIPTFDEFLSLVNGKTGILNEIKGVNPFDVSIATATVERLKTYKGNIALQSFNFGAVKYCRTHSSLPCGQLCTWRGPSGKNRDHIVDFMGKLWVCKLSKPHFIAYDVRAMGKEFPENTWVKKARERTPFLMWTINNAEKLDIALKYADNIIFENLSPETVKNDYIDKKKTN